MLLKIPGVSQSRAFPGDPREKKLCSIQLFLVRTSDRDAAAVIYNTPQKGPKI